MPAKVTDYMASTVISIAPDTGVREAFFTMRERGIRHLPVIDEAARLVGLVSDRELLDNHVDAAPVLDKTGSLAGILSAVDLLRAFSDMIEQR